MARFIRLLSLFILFFVNSVYASPPVRQSSYTTNDTISSTAVTANENVIFNYLQGGVDTYADNSIVNADISSAANIQSDKLNLTSMAQSLSNTGTFANTGNVTITGTLTVTGTLKAGGGSTNKVVCWKSTTALGYCSDAPGAGGSCTCN